MSNVKKWLEQLVPDAQIVPRRFPLTVILMLVFTGFLVFDANTNTLDNELQLRVFSGLILAAYLSVNLIFIGEGRLYFYHDRRVWFGNNRCVFL